jgi:hypothetical protein
MTEIYEDVNFPPLSQQSELEEREQGAGKEYRYFCDGISSE